MLRIKAWRKSFNSYHIGAREKNVVNFIDQTKVLYTTVTNRKLSQLVITTEM